MKNFYHNQYEKDRFFKINHNYLSEQFIESEYILEKINEVVKKNVKVKTSSGDLIDHPIYTLVAKEGSGQSPSRADSTYVS